MISDNNIIVYRYRSQTDPPSEMYSEIHVNSSKQVSVLGSTAIQTTAKFCFKCGNNLSSTEVQDTMQQRPKCVRCQKELRMSEQPFCDECGAHQQEAVFKWFKQDIIDDK